MSPKLSVIVPVSAPIVCLPHAAEHQRLGKDDDSRSACVLGRLALGMDGIRETSICLSNKADRANNSVQPYLLSDVTSRYGIIHLYSVSST